jgi:tRNA-specific 2-thiouridylase
MCNREIKFGVLLDWARNAGFDALATGHYARIHKENDCRWLMQAKDLSKDQTYFLSRMPSESLKHALFPLGQLEKRQVKDIAADLGMEWLLKRPESMGICFVGSQQGRSHFSAVLDAYLPTETPGPLIMLDTGKAFGEHTGSSKMTIGQNARIHSMPSKLYVAKKEGSTVYLVDSFQHPALNPKSFQIRDLILNRPPESASGPMLCSIRSNDKHGTPVVSLSEYEINLDKQIFAPAPGQYAVLYRQLTGHDRPVCIGSAIID